MSKCSFARVLSGLALVLLAGCSADGGGKGEPGPTPEVEGASFELSVDATKLPIVQGSTAELAVEVVRKNGFEGAVVVTASGLPAGAAMTSVTIPEGETEASLVFSALPDAPHSLPSAVTLRGSSTAIQKELALTVTVCGLPGALDTSFEGGRVVVPVGAGEDYAYAIAAQSDGKLLVAGSSAENQGDFALVRLQRDGALDSSFGQGGKVTTPIGAGTDVARAIAIQSDGKILLAGSSVGTGTGTDFALARYTSDGRLDTSFGDGGKVVTALSNDADVAYALMLQKDGKIVLGGQVNNGASATGLDFALVRYDSNGTLDATFGTQGHVFSALAQNSGSDVVYSLVGQMVEGEERLVAAGGEGDFALARFTASGALDATFGANGKVVGLLGSVIGAARAVRVTAQGELLVAGHKAHDFALARLTEDGELDATFGTKGITITPITENWDEAQALQIDAEGKIVLGGWAYEGSSSSGNFALARYSPLGQLDQSFGTGGIAVTPVASGTKDDAANAVLLSMDDRVPTVRILLAGSANGSNHDFAVTRYWR
ncbi:MAG TPA: hypothetical protein VFQ35_23650 [Polyangiaceae bacterium]|nr:hypothetical protein [Polyangiaceae bacterium]